MEKVDVVIIGAGIVGLSVACEISRVKDSVYLLERHDSFGRETSSRNSEVIHAGIYYPKDSLKAKTCLEGNSLIYETCAKNNIPHRKLGKLILATDRSQAAHLERLFDNAMGNGVRELELLSGDRIGEMEPNIKADFAIYSKITGILDSHSLMKYYVFKAAQQGAVITYNAEVRGIRKVSGGYEVTVFDSAGEEFKFLTEVLVNCAGLESDKIAEMAGIDIDKAGYRLKYCKGQYFSLPVKKSRLIKRLIYPVTTTNSAGLGIHATPNLTGTVRLGPDDEYIGRGDVDYDVDKNARTKFYDSAVGFLPFLGKEDLTPDTSGVRPKLQGPGEDFRDFIIKEESGLGLPGFIDLIGVESPGLTAAPAIARMVKDMI